MLWIRNIYLKILKDELLYSFLVFFASSLSDSGRHSVWADLEWCLCPFTFNESSGDPENLADGSLAKILGGANQGVRGVMAKGLSGWYRWTCKPWS